jgi:hypothetical protein
VFPYVARIAPTTTGTQATRASVFTRSDTLRVRDVSEDRVNPSPTSVPTAEAGEYRPRRSAAKPPEHPEGQRDQQSRQRRATREYDVSEPCTGLHSQHRSAQPSADGAEETSQLAGFHASRAQLWGRFALRTLGSVAHGEQDAVLPTADISRSPTFVGNDQTARNAPLG